MSRNMHAYKSSVDFFPTCSLHKVKGDSKLYFWVSFLVTFDILPNLITKTMNDFSNEP